MNEKADGKLFLSAFCVSCYTIILLDGEMAAFGGSAK